MTELIPQEEPVATPLLAPEHGVPELVVDEKGLQEVLDQMKAGSGPIAIDAERASGYKYSQRAYLIQIKRNGGGLHLIDPVAIGQTPLWDEMSKSFAQVEWIIHASTQDLPCLREVGLQPQILFDTELGGRIAGCERVGLGALTELLLGLSLAKEHSAVDWSIRPLRHEWLNYAALDVEVLIDLRDKVEELLESKGKLTWAMQDFQAILTAPPNPPRVDPWRRTSGMHKVRDRQTLAIIRDLWIARDEYAKHLDISPGRVFNDEALVEIATKRPADVTALTKIISRRSRVVNPPTKKWHEIMIAAIALPDSELPEVRLKSDALPPPKIWPERNPPAHARLTHARAAVLDIASTNELPAENLISPELIRRLCWATPPVADDLESYSSDFLAKMGARPWQTALLAPALALALLQTEPVVIPEVIEEEPAAE